RALAAMKRAFDREWAPGEHRLMADFLHSLGQIAYDPLAKEQVRELTWLHQQQKPGSFDRLHVGAHLARILHGYGQSDRAADLLTAELAAFEQANQGVLPTDAN